MAFTIALCQQLLAGKGVLRVHGGGFAGAALVFVPKKKLRAPRLALKTQFEKAIATRW